MQNNWFTLNTPNEIDSPALLIYKDSVQENIDLMLKIAGNADKLIPHVKTHKMLEVAQMQMAAGISKFKCATIAEAEMLVNAGAKWILLAYQLVSPKTERFIQLIQANPKVKFASLVDSLESAQMLNDIFSKENLTANVFIDVNNGMNRTGHEVNEALVTLFHALTKQKNLNFMGFHVYDGHIRDEEFTVRKVKSDAAFENFKTVCASILSPNHIIIAGGSPSFTVHALRKDIFCSPGTCIFWDWGYGDKFQDQPFFHAAVILTRVISKPHEGIITIDLGHKAVAAENPIEKRFRFLNLENYEVSGQSEEHGVLKVANWEQVNIGDVLYAVPYHVCPTVNLYEEANVIQAGKLIDKWQVVARKRKIILI